MEVANSSRSNCGRYHGIAKAKWGESLQKSRNVKCFRENKKEVGIYNMKVFGDLDEHFQWSSGDQSQSSGFQGGSEKRGGRGSRHRISKARGEMDEYVEVDTGLRKALRVLCLIKALEYIC